jgi:AcrR family transcriptional regulator
VDVEFVDPRSVRSRAVVLQATIDLMYERGMQAVSVDAIVDRSGVAKTTVYRHWPTREALIYAAWESLVAAAEEPQSGKAKNTVMAVALAFGRGLSSPPMERLIPDLLASASRDEKMRDVYHDILRARGTPLADAVATAVANGVLPTGTDVEMVVSLILGPIVYSQVIRRNAVDPAFIRRVVSIVMESTSHDLPTGRD